MSVWITAHAAVWSILVPLAAALAAFLVPRQARWIALAAALGIVWLVGQLALATLETGPQHYAVGGWQAPLGIDLYLDGLSALLLTVTSLVGVATTVYAIWYFAGNGPHGREGTYFWPLWLFLWAALNALFLSADLFNIYVTLELLGLAAVALVALAGKADALAAAMRYLLVGLLGSLGYLLGVAFLYGQYGVLDLALMREMAEASPAVWIALGLMTVGLLLKTALFPLHFWLPPAHSSAPAPVSAVLSALVVKASFYLLLRLWLDVFGGLVPAQGAQLLGLLGAGAIVWGSVQALLTERLKLLVAYSTVAQLGYLFLLFPLAQSPAVAYTAFSGVLIFLVAHALAKSALFFASGSILQVAGHDRIGELNGTSQSLPITTFALALAGVSLVGLPPSGGFIAKWLMLNAAFSSGQWWWAVVLVGGSLLAAAYVFRVLSHAFTQLRTARPHGAVASPMEWTPLILALMVTLLGLVMAPALELLSVGAPVSGALLTERLP